MQIANRKVLWLFAGLVVIANIVTNNTALAQCQGRGGGQSTGSSTTANSLTSSPYTQTALGNGYSQNPLGQSIGYNQFVNMADAADAYNRSMRMAAAQQVQAQSMMVQYQMAQVKAMRKQMAEASAQKRKAAQAEKAEALAARQERESARRSSKYEVPKLEVPKLVAK